MRPIAVRVLEARAETPTQTTLVLDWSPEATPGQFVMVWNPGVDEVPMGFSQVRPRAAITGRSACRSIHAGIAPM